MSEPPGQVRTELPASAPGAPGATVISSSREVEQGARSMLILAPGLFRLDVIPEDDMVQTIVRNLSTAERAWMRPTEVAGASSLAIAGAEARAISTGRFGGEILLADGEEERAVARLIVGSVCHFERGVTVFTAQATLL